MPWVEGRSKCCGLKGRERIPIHAFQSQTPAAFQAAIMGCLLSQGIGLRPQPWAKISRPVGPVDRSHQKPPDVRQKAVHGDVGFNPRNERQNASISLRAWKRSALNKS